MTLRSIRYLYLVVFLSLMQLSQQSYSETLFYTLRSHSGDRTCSSEQTWDSLKKHYRKITILTPQAYFIDENGVVHGDIDADIVAFAKSKSIKLMPLVTNRAFDKAMAHQFLTNEAAQTSALNTLLHFCEENHFNGLQIDFEMIDVKDRDALTVFFKRAADLLHAKGYKISFAVAPVVTDHPDSLFQKKLYQTWEGAYDFKKIGQFADFVSVMAYNQHASGTTPGSTANGPWVDEVARYAISQIPSHKVSLGLPAYSTYWYEGSSNGAVSGHFHVMMAALNYEDAIKLYKMSHARLYWNAEEKYHFLIRSRHDLNEYIFLEDKKSFAYKVNLVKKYHLRGVSVFDLGTEDPKIWSFMPS